VALVDVPVQQVVGDYTFWIGPAPDRRVPVVLHGERMGRQPERRVEIRDGQRVDVFGMIRLVRDVANMDEAWALQPAEREELREALIYISADRARTR
jgi:hypothetical protein